MDIRRSPNRKWTKGMVLACLEAQLAPLGPKLINGRLVIDGSDTEIVLELDLRPWRKDAEKNVMDVYVKFFAQLKTQPIRGERIWPPGMDLRYIKQAYNYNTEGLEEGPYLLETNVPYSETSIYKDVQDYLLPFVKKIMALEGYFAFLLGEFPHQPDRYTRDDVRDIGLLIIAIQLASVMGLPDYGYIASQKLNQLKNGSPFQSRQVQAYIEAMPEVKSLMRS